VRDSVSLLRRIDRWLFAPGPGSRVWGLRTGLAALFAVRLALGEYRGLAGQPEALFRPPSAWHLLDRMPPVEVLVAVQVVGAVLAVLAVLSWRPRVTFAGAWLCFVFLEGLVASRVKISHNEILGILAAVPLLVAPVAVSWRDRDDDPALGWPQRVSLVVLAGAYFYTGLGKVLTGGLSWATSDNVRWSLAAGARSAKPPTHAIAQFVADHGVLAHGLAFATLVFELGFVLILFVPRLRAVFAAVIISFHVGIYLTLGLDYWSWVVTVVVVLLPWEQLVPRIQARSAKRAMSPSTS
jgi:hypothetical protein